MAVIVVKNGVPTVVSTLGANVPPNIVLSSNYTVEDIITLDYLEFIALPEINPNCVYNVLNDPNDSNYTGFVETDPIYMQDRSFLALKSEIPDISGLATQSSVNALSSDIDEINSKIPAQANNTNLLTDRALVESLVAGMIFRQLTPTATGDTPFASFDALVSATEYFYQGTITTPTANDGASYFNSDSTVEGLAVYNGASWSHRFWYNQVFTSAQTLELAADNISPAVRTSGNQTINGNLNVEGLLQQGGNNVLTQANLSSSNILHNWDFRIPVNQRALTRYDTVGTTIDRWRLATPVSAGLSVVSGGINLDSVLNCYIWQTIEYGSMLTGKTLTLSVEIDNIIYKATYLDNETGYAPALPNGFLIGFFRNSWSVVIYNQLGSATALVQRVKLEIGINSTLANDPPMDFGKELSACQRYQLPLTLSTSVARANYVSANSMWFNIPTPTSLRANPTLSGGQFEIRDMQGSIQSGFTFTTGLRNNTIVVFASKDGHGLLDGMLGISTNSILEANL